MGDLDDLFNNYKQRKQQEQDADAQRRAEEQELRDISLNALKEKVLPILRDLAVSIRQKGHQATVQESFGSFVYPSVTLSFTPVSGDSIATHTRASTLRFAHTETGTIEMTQEIWDKEGHTVSRPKATIPPSNISEDLIRSQALAFISVVLKAN